MEKQNIMYDMIEEILTCWNIKNVHILIYENILRKRRRIIHTRKKIKFQVIMNTS